MSPFRLLSRARPRPARSHAGRRPATAPERVFLLASTVLAAAGLGATIGIRLAERPGEKLPAFFHLFALDWPGAAVALLVLLAGASSMTRPSGEDDPEAPVRLLGQRGRLVAAASALALALGAVVVYRAYPLALDEYAAIFQAEAFAAGKLAGRLPGPLLSRLVPFLGIFFAGSPETGRVISTYWPGFALLLAPFAWLGVPWLLNPLLGAGCLLLLAHLARRLIPDDAARGWVLLFALASPGFVVNALSYYAMTAHLFFNLLYAALLLGPRPGAAVAAGVAGSLALTLHNPLPHTLFGLPWLLWTARRGGPRRLALVLAGYLPLAILLGLGWVWVRGSVTGGAGPGYPFPGTRRLSDLVRAVFDLPSPLSLSFRTMELLKLALWAVPGLPVLAALGWRESRDLPALRLFGWSFLLTVIGYSFVPFHQGHGWGARYLHPAWMALPLLGAAFLARPRSNRRAWARLAWVLALGSLLLGNGLRAVQVRRFIDAQLAQLPAGVRAPREVWVLSLEHGYYTKDRVQNDPFLRSRVIILAGSGPHEDSALVRRYFPGARAVPRPGPHQVWALPRLAPAAPPP